MTIETKTRERHPVLCVDNQPIFCEGLRSRLEREPDLAWAGQTKTCENVVAEAHRTGAEVAVLEIQVNGGDPFEAIRDVTSVCPRTRVMILSNDVRDHAIDEAMEAGALGYFSKQDEPDAIIEGIHSVLQGKRALGPSVRERCVQPRAIRSNGNGHRANGSSNGHNGHSNGNGNGHGPVARYNLLTPREREVLRMIGQGMSRRAIAEAMHRSPKTVDCHRAAVMEKLGINDRVELARYAIREGIADAW